jgi:hypothetical protein
VRLFLGDPGPLGLGQNHYGTTAVIRQEVLEHASSVDGAADPSWPLLAGLALGGAHILALPQPLVRREQEPGSVRTDPVGAHAVLELFEGASDTRPDPSLLAAVLALDTETTATPRTANSWERLARRLSPRTR